MLQFATPVTNGSFNPGQAPVGGYYAVGYTGIPTINPAAHYVNCGVSTGLPLWAAAGCPTPVIPNTTAAHVDGAPTSKRNAKSQHVQATVNGAPTATPVFVQPWPVFSQTAVTGTIPFAAINTIGQPIGNLVNPWINPWNSMPGLSTCNTGWSFGSNPWTNLAGVGFGNVNPTNVNPTNVNPAGQLGLITLGCNPITGQPIVCPAPISSAWTNPLSCSPISSTYGNPFGAQICTTIGFNPVTGQPVVCPTPSGIVPSLVNSTTAPFGQVNPWLCPAPVSTIPQYTPWNPVNPFAPISQSPVVSPVIPTAAISQGYAPVHPLVSSIVNPLVNPLVNPVVNPVGCVIDPSHVANVEAVMGLQREAA
jgi:hypothetical protein